MDSTLDGQQLAALFAHAASALHAAAPEIDAMNVYPVPDGDTGSNMAATLGEAVDQVRLLGGPLTAGSVCGSLARGALYGARGNSGVILSQALRGLAAVCRDRETVGAGDLAEALEQAADMAYAAVARPVEGTMLTVLRAAGNAAREAALEASATVVSVLGAAATAADRAEALTIGQLPVLAEAHVTDSGGEGICVILGAMVAALTGAPPPVPSARPMRPIAQLGDHDSERFGFCTEFIIEAATRPLALHEVQALAGSTDRSLVVVGDESAMRVHVHTDEPETLLERAAHLGSLARVKVDDMSAQHERFESTGSGAAQRIATLALSPGPGFTEVFESLGAKVMRLYDNASPSAGDIAAAATSLRVPDVIVLPNHRDLVLTARQAASLAQCTVTVVPATSVPQGVAAALAFGEARSVADCAARMEAAMRSVRTVEVTTAGASRTVDGIAVQAGDEIAMVNHRLVACGDEIGSVLIRGLESADAESAGLVTIYPGATVDAAAAASIAAGVRARFPGAEVEIVPGGQGRYTYIVAVDD